MNIKSMIAAAAVVASTVASAAIFNWTITGGYDADNLLLQGYSNSQWKGEGYNNNENPNDASGNKAHEKHVDNAFKWEKNTLYVRNTDSGADWSKFDSLIFKLTKYTGEGATSNYIKSNSAKWEDIYNALTGKNGSYDFTIKAGNSTLATIKLTSDVIPEPTSGLMLLLGAGMLALRRKTVRA